MPRLTTNQSLSRLIVALALALLLALRLLSPAGFMPAFDRGAVTIVACPDEGGAPAAAHDHHGSKAHVHHACPYAASSALGGLADDMPAIVAVLFVGLALLLGRAFTFLDKQRGYDRPPAQGPPIPA